MYEVLRKPQDDEATLRMLEEVEAFLTAMYDEREVAIHGEVNFSIEHFLFLWTTGGIFLLVKRDDTHKPCLVAMCSQYRDLWSGRMRIEVQRISMIDSLDEATERQGVIDYLKGVSSLLKFDQLYYNTHYVDGSVFREMVWNDKR